MIAILVFLVLPIFFFFLLQKNRKNKKNILPPSPPGLPFIGNLFQIDTSAPHLHLWKLSKKYGPLMSLKFGNVPTLVVSSARMAKEVMKTHDLDFPSKPRFTGQQKLSYNGLDISFAPYGDYWRGIKKICVLQIFSSKKVHTFRSIREDEVLWMISKISKLVSDSKIVNFSETVMTLGSSIICRVAFGKRYEDEGYERSRFHSLLIESQAMMGTFFISDFLPLLGWVDKISGLSGRLEKNFKEMDLFYQEIIDDHLDPKRENSDHEDITDVLLRLRKENMFSIDLTFDHIKAVLMNMLVAGTDTSAATLVWVMTALLKNPEVMKKAQNEIRNLIGKGGSVTEDYIKNLPYMNAVIKETMRLYPPAPFLLRESTQKTNINNYEIQPKTLVYVNVWAIGKDPEAWENPNEFYPERFLNSSIDFKGLDFEFIPFGAGRRGCPGIHIGVAAVEIALANLLYAFNWELPNGIKKEDIDIEVLPGLTMHKKNALCLVAKKVEW